MPLYGMCVSRLSSSFAQYFDSFFLCLCSFDLRISLLLFRFLCEPVSSPFDLPRETLELKLFSFPSTFLFIFNYSFNKAMYWRWSNIVTLTLLMLTLLTMKQHIYVDEDEAMYLCRQQWSNWCWWRQRNVFMLTTMKQTTVNWKWREIFWGNCCTFQRELFYAKWHLTLNNWCYRI